MDKGEVDQLVALLQEIRDDQRSALALMRDHYARAEKLQDRAEKLQAAGEALQNRANKGMKVVIPIILFLLAALAYLVLRLF